MKSTLFLFLVLTLSLAGSCFGSVAVVGSLARHHNVQPGETFEGIILLKNTGAEAVEMQIVQNDYLFSADGANHYDKPGTQPRSNAAWLAVSPSRATLPPQGTASVYYKGKIPQDAVVAGTYWSMIMIEPVATPAPEVKGAKDQIAMGLQTRTRFAVQIVSEIGTTGTEELKVQDKSLVVNEGKTTLHLDVANTGERVQIPALWAELYNAQGISLGRFEGGRWRIYPGCSVRYKVDLTDVPAGKYTAMVVMDTGGEYVTGAQYSLELAP
jgi:hypothetical protein